MTTVVRFHELGGPEVMRLEDAEVGEPGPGEVRIRVEAIGVNRAEALFRTGAYIAPVKRFPARLGSESAGVVEAVGPGVEAFAVGDAVSSLPGFSPNDYGVYGEAAILPASSLLHRPEGMDAITGAAVWMAYLTAHGALVDVGGMRPGDVVALNAASSGIGLAAIQIAQRVGATPIAITRGCGKKDRLLAEGAAEVIVADEEDVADRLLALTCGRGVEFVFDAVAGSGVVELTRALAPGGTHFLYGMLSGEPTPFPGFTLGMPPVSLRSYTVRETTKDPERLRRAAGYVASGLRSGAFRPVVDRVFPLAEVVAAHQYMERGGQVGKIVLKP